MILLKKYEDFINDLKNTKFTLTKEDVVIVDSHILKQTTRSIFQLNNIHSLVITKDDLREKVRGLQFKSIIVLCHLSNEDYQLIKSRWRN